MEILFVGGFFSDGIESQILRESRGVVQYAANKFQWNLIEGLSAMQGVNLELISAPFIGAFPLGYSKMFFPGVYEHHGAFSWYSVPFFNLWGLRNISRRNSLVRRIRPFAVKPVSKKVIIVYSAHTPFLQAAVLAKKKDPSTHICLVVPDLPQYMNLSVNPSILYKAFKVLDIRLFEANLRFIDSFVLLTEKMKDPLKVGTRPYVVVEGIVDPDSASEPARNRECEGVSTIVYTGTLHQRFGVVNLVDAFRQITCPDARLIVCGAGDAEEYVRRQASKDNRITFLGQVSNEEALVIQRMATVLVNPRQNNEDFTKYSFPSKNMEYLVTGNPVVAYKLDGIPDEYDDFLFYVEDDSVSALAKKIEQVLSLPPNERARIGMEAQKFVVEKKNKYVVAHNIVEMIKSAINGS